MRKELATAPKPDSATTSSKAKPETFFRSQPSVTLNEIWLQAYRKWEAAGMPDGDSVRFWLEAEQELLRR